MGTWNEYYKDEVEGAANHEIANCGLNIRVDDNCVPSLDVVKMIEEFKSTLPLDAFPPEPGVTDVLFVVENRKIHASKSILIQASPVFKAMFTSEFKEKDAEEIRLPEKNYESFTLFLRCISPKEYVELDESIVAVVLPLAHEYDVSAIKEQCQWWLLNDMKMRSIKSKTLFNYTSVQDDLEFFIRSLFYGSEYQLNLLYKQVFKQVILHKASRYWDYKFYKQLDITTKCELMEGRVKTIEDSVEKIQEEKERKSKSRGPRSVYKTDTSAQGSLLQVHSKCFV